MNDKKNDAKKNPAGPEKKIVLPPDYDKEVSAPDGNDPDSLPDPDEELLETPPYEAPEPGEGP